MSHSKIVVVGQGYVGLPLAIRAVDVGHTVVGFDVNSRRVEQLQRGESYVEDISAEQLIRAAATGRYTATADPGLLKDFAVALITVPTPLSEGSPDLSYIEQAGKLLADHLNPGALVVLESTTYPGTTEEFLADLLFTHSGLRAGTDFFLGYSPERIDPGNSNFGLRETPKLVSGVDEQSAKAVQEFYDSITDHTVMVSRPREAELAKLIENTFRHVNVALVNELAMFAADLGVDVWEALDAAATKPFGFMRFNPGPGVGGHCLPIDPSYLSWHVRISLGRSFRFVELANDINDHMPEYVVQRLARGLNRHQLPINGSRILLLGLAYKPNTSDLRESPALAAAERLLRLGATLRYVDNHVAPLNIADSSEGIELRRADLTSEELRSAAAVVVLTDHDDVDYDLVVRESRYVLDTRHRCKGDNVEYL